MAPFRMDRQGDFADLLLASCYEGIFPALKDSGDWTVYLDRACRYLIQPEGKCRIHSDSSQSMICKSYNAHNCWYVRAFDPERYTTMIPFSTDGLILYEKENRLIEDGFDTPVDWNGLCIRMQESRKGKCSPAVRQPVPRQSFTLSFKKSRESRFLFFPPYNRPESLGHFELLSFRLGFPGIYLAFSDTSWAYLVETRMVHSSLRRVRQDYYPSLEHRDGVFSFDRVSKAVTPYSETGEHWLILKRSHLELLKALTAFDASGNVRRFPSTAEVLEMLKLTELDPAA